MEKIPKSITRRSSSSIPCPKNLRTMDSLLSVAPLLEDITDRAGIGIIISDRQDKALFVSKCYQRLLESRDEIFEDELALDLEDSPASLRVLSSGRRADSPTLNLVKMALIGEISVGLAHDFRNLLCVLEANLDHLESAAKKVSEPDVKSDLLETLADVSNAASVAKGICFRMEMLASRKADVRAVNLSTVVSSTIQLAKPVLENAKDKNKYIIVKTKVDGSLWAHAVASELQMAILNILINAVEHAYSSGQKGKIEISGYSSDSAVFLTISNDGDPIPQIIQEELLQSPLSTTEGHGYGLYTAAQMLKSFGGKLSFTSGTEGTTFFLSLPIVQGLQ